MKKRNITAFLAAVIAAVFGFYGVDIDLSSLIPEEQSTWPSSYLASNESLPGTTHDPASLKAAQVLGSHPSTSHFRDRVYGDSLPQSGVMVSPSDSLF